MLLEASVRVDCDGLLDWCLFRNMQKGPIKVTGLKSYSTGKVLFVKCVHACCCA